MKEQIVSRRPPQVKILDKALRVLMLFTPEKPEWGASQMVREVAMPKSTVHRILRVFEQHGFLSQHPDTRRFRLGLAALELGRRTQGGLELRRVALPVMEQLSARSGETVVLQVLSSEGDRVVCIERVQQARGLRLILDVGTTAPLHAGCSSKVLMAFLDAAQIEQIISAGLHAITTRTVTDPAQLRAELAEIRRIGYGVSYEETDEGAAGVSVPVRNSRDEVVASLTIAGPISRVDDRIPEFTDLALAGAQRIGTSLGHLPRAAARTPVAISA